MDLEGILKVILFIFIGGCTLYVIILVLDGINNSLKEIPWWMFIVLPLGGIYLYDIFKQKSGD